MLTVALNNLSRDEFIAWLECHVRLLSDDATLSVLIVEDEARFRSSFVAAVERAPYMNLLGAAANFAEGLPLLDLSPDVLLVDLQLPDGNGIYFIREASRRLPHCEAVVVTIESCSSTKAH